MSYWWVPIAASCAAWLVQGCVIYTEGESGQPPRPPPTPPHKVQQQRPPARPPAKPGNTKPGARKGGLIHKLGVKGRSTIAVTVTGGTCVVAIDGEYKGLAAQSSHVVTAGAHVVTCQPADGALQEQRTEVAEGQTANVEFSLAGGTTDKTSLPVSNQPPVGRPTPGAQ